MLGAIGGWQEKDNCIALPINTGCNIAPSDGIDGVLAMRRKRREIAVETGRKTKTGCLA